MNLSDEELEIELQYLFDEKRVLQKKIDSLDTLIIGLKEERRIRKLAYERIKAITNILTEDDEY